MNVPHVAQLLKGVERFSTSACSSPTSSPQIARLSLNARNFTSISAGNSPLSSPMSARKEAIRNRANDANSKTATNIRRSFSASVTQVTELAEETPVEVLLYKLLEKAQTDDKQEGILLRTRTVLQTAGISKVGQLKQRKEDLERIGLQPEVIRKIRMAFEGTPRFQAATFQIKPQPIAEITEPVPTPSPSLTQASWMWKQGTSRPFINKSPEENWSDYNQSREEASWIRKERIPLESMWNVSGDVKPKEDPLQFHSDWKANIPGKYNSPWRPAISINEDAMISPSFSYNQSNIEVIPKGDDFDWKDPKSHRAFFDMLGEKLGVKSLNDWYFINILDVKKYEAAYEFIKANYGSSLTKALLAIYPEYKWKVWNFDYGYKGMFNDEPDTEAKDKIVESLKGSPKSQDRNTTFKQYKNHWQVRNFATSSSDSWAHEASPYVREKTQPDMEILTSGMTIAPKADSEALKSLNFPTSIRSVFESSIRKPEENLFSVVKGIFPDLQVALNHRDAGFEYSDTKRPFDVSVFIPELKIAFEYIEDPNYTWQYAQGAKFSAYIFSDAKRNVCEKLGITLIEVPSWWDGKTASLVSAIRRVRPDVLADNEVPISIRDTKSYFLARSKKDVRHCVGCKSPFKENQLVIQAHSCKSSPHYFCVNANCIGKAKKGSNGELPYFDGTVKVSPEIKRHHPEIPNAEGIKWIEA